MRIQERLGNGNMLMIVLYVLYLIVPRSVSLCSSCSVTFPARRVHGARGKDPAEIKDTQVPPTFRRDRLRYISPNSVEWS